MFVNSFRDYILGFRTAIHRHHHHHHYSQQQFTHHFLFYHYLFVFIFEWRVHCSKVLGRRRRPQMYSIKFIGKFAFLCLWIFAKNDR